MERVRYEAEWRTYFQRSGLSVVLRILIGLGTNHAQTQCLIVDVTEEGGSF